MFFSWFLDPSFPQGSLILYISLWMILALHLSIVQVTIWVLVLSDTLIGSLWVRVTNAVLFRSLLHINAAKELAAEYSMWWQQLFLIYFSTLPSSCTFTVHILINRTSWNVILDNRTHLLTPSLFSRGDTPPRLTSPNLYSHSLLVQFLVLLLPYCWSILGPLCLFGQAQYLGLCSHKSNFIFSHLSEVT